MENDNNGKEAYTEREQKFREDVSKHIEGLKRELGEMIVFEDDPDDPDTVIGKFAPAWVEHFDQAAQAEVDQAAQAEVDQAAKLEDES